MSEIPITHGHPRLGVPDDRMGVTATPLLQPNGRVAVMLMIIPPVQLKDAPRDVVEAYVAAHKKSILASIVDEVFRSYTSDPLDGTAARNVAEALVRHAESLTEEP